ncbi:hypothetical protein W97_02323 [Coniosporium apollinis CBS 100218]|uniref:ubiquitinyl hydrolase 1 n=1 Tax=Coniosporium apollinis (strain CBS 100218) TaxID=1168221 RepID=R7YNA8_CONA1|nr:uncharacterized protein W97_02323 [Coniosporium apollinis CBS 100218]EON63096.1 hypothetical protein W97_02323 [Coniosporium apollinis CBS 100218]
MLVESDYDEKQPVTNILPDEAMDDAEPSPESEPLADDFEGMIARHMPPLPDLEVETEAINTWEIKDWRTMRRREQGPIFKAGEHPWRVLFFPYGNNVDYASFYLEHGFEDQPPEGWYACVQFMLALWNPSDPSMVCVHEARHRFTAEEGDWGFTRFAELRKLFHQPWNDSGRPMVENNRANVTAYVRVYKDPTGVLWHNFINYDSKKETGMVGLKNQGATCYLNSLLQSLYFTNTFRKAVYQIPTENESDVRANSAYALQRLFYQLQRSDVAVSTNELTSSFGWDSRQIFEQQDVQELSRLLLERMEEKMKGTGAEHAMADLFAGKTKTYISCINVPYESSRIEDYWDISLTVLGRKNIEDSLNEFTEVETLEGDNKYFAEGYGLQDAKKGTIFESFPQVLHIQLKRFMYDIQRDAMMKVNDRYEFPETFDASPWLSETADKSEPYVYRLHGVLVHSGDLNAGHYYAFLKPTKDGPFYKFDDDRVTRATMREVLEENFGGDYGNQANGNAQQRNPYTRTWSTKRSMSAYMLVYIRESRIDSILPNEDEVEPPPHLAERFTAERAELLRRQKERQEAHLYIDVQVANLYNFTSYQGFDIVPWKQQEPEDPSTPRTFHVLRDMKLADFIKEVAEDMGAEPDMLRPWAMVNRQNGTTRPDTALIFPDMSIEEAANKYGTKTTNFRIWIEQTEERDADGKPVWGDSRVDLQGVPNNRPIMLFLKHFDARAQTLLGAGSFYAAWQDKVSDLSPQILKLMGWPSGTEFRLFEEIKQNMIEKMKPKSTLAGSELQDGDIITVQRVLSDKETSVISANGNYTNVQDFYDYLLNRVSVTFAPKVTTANDDAKFVLTLSKKMSYDQFAEKVGEHLRVDPTHLRFSTVNYNSGRAKAPVRRTQNQTLGHILQGAFTNFGANQTQRTDCLIYEVLELSLTELESRKNVKVHWLPEGITKQEPYDILVPKNGTMADVLDSLQKKANLSDETMQRLRIYEAHGGKFYKELPPTFGVVSINEFVTIYVEKIPDEEVSRDEETEKLVSAYHFDRESNKPHNIPFLFLVKQDEVFKDTKERLSKRTGIKGKQFEKIKFAVITRANYSKPEYLSDGKHNPQHDVLSEKLVSKDDLLGLDHADKAKNNWGRTEAIMIK